ncbi:alpha/beta fold hydrolase [Microcella daejeonensis]|uniref:alpha/beta hydrolase n=1 Tax=Microcella daejeonensis TaxID=2994971 RepID=UPI002270F353|nr:alpha/beta hydrolase [Microcella daejeonensis]WAB84667.1 alpha/beta fold hydrolase [Microcella daejeonensis]
MTTSTCTVFVLPGLGFAADAAAPLAAALGERFRVVPVESPGHGDALDAADGSVGALVDAALATIEREADGGPWMLAAHSMGGKIAALVAAQVLSGEARVFGLTGLVLLAPSPPTPEPMSDEKRAEMLGWVEAGPLSPEHARAFVAANVAAPLDADAEQAAVAQVRRTSPVAWRRWLSEGSREDVAAAVGALDLPVVVLAGEEDADLGSAAQPGLLAAVYPRARFVALAGAGHLLPYERPAEVAEAIVELREEVVRASAPVAPEWARLIASERTPVEARGLLARRALADDPDYRPRALSAAQLDTLRALADRLVPQPAGGRIDLAARVDADLARGRGDGWRPAGLPADATAYAQGLDAIAAVWPAETAAQDALIQGVLDGEGLPGSPWSAALLAAWFDDARTDLVRAWLAHPASFTRVGYDGFATAAADAPRGAEPAGWATLTAGERDAWEPTELGSLRASTAPISSTAPDQEDAA